MAMAVPMMASTMMTPMMIPMMVPVVAPFSGRRVPGRKIKRIISFVTPLHWLQNKITRIESFVSKSGDSTHTLNETLGAII